MKVIHSLFFALALTALIMFPGFSRSAESSSATGNTRYEAAPYSIRDGDYTFVRVLIVDKWFLFVYDGTELIDIVPE